VSGQGPRKGGEEDPVSEAAKRNLLAAFATLVAMSAAAALAVGIYNSDWFPPVIKEGLILLGVAGVGLAFNYGMDLLTRHR
jgi:hypothetical protein